MSVTRAISLSFAVSPLFMASAAMAAERFVAPDGDDDNPGTLEAPFATVSKGLTETQNGDILSLRGGTYRLMDGGTSDQFSRSGATDESYVTIRAYPGEQPVLLGSLSTEQMNWEPASGGLFRLDASFLPRDPAGMFAGDVRIEHVMKTVGGVRSHADASALENPGEWTKADATGAGCSNENGGCYIYLRPPTGVDPNEQVFELSQRKLFFALGTSHLRIVGLEILYTQDAAITIEGGRGQIVEDCTLGHNSNSNDNAYSIFISYGGGATVRNNRAFDSKYWGGTSNSRGITLMDMDPSDPSVVEGNEVYDIVGQGITTKNGVAGLLVRNNFVHDVGICVEPASRRCHWTNPDCTISDPENYPGGGWIIRENAFVRCGAGVSPASGEQNEDNLIYNNVFYDCDAGVDVRLAHPGTLIANNVFARSARGVYLNGGNSGETKVFEDFAGAFSAHHNLFFDNDDDYLLRPDWGGPGGSGIGYSLVEAQGLGSEADSLEGDPLFASGDEADFHLDEASPARGAGDGALYDLSAVDIGRYPLGDEAGEGGAGGGAGTGGGGVGGGGSSASGGASAGGAAGDPAADSGEGEAGCGCRAAGASERGSTWWGLMALFGFAVAGWRRWYAARGERSAAAPGRRAAHRRDAPLRARA